MLVLDFINVGNGDAILVREMDGGVQRFAMLVDCGHDALQRDDHPELGDPNSRRIYAGDFLRKTACPIWTSCFSPTSTGTMWADWNGFWRR